MSREFIKSKCFKTGAVVVARPIVQTANPESVNWPEYVIFERWNDGAKVMEKVMIHWQNVAAYVAASSTGGLGIHGVMLKGSGGYAPLRGKVVFASGRYWSDSGKLCKVTLSGSGSTLVDVVWPEVANRHPPPT